MIINLNKKENKNLKMNFIIFQKFNFNYFFFIFYLISCLAGAFLDVDEDNNNSPGENGHFYQFILLYIETLSDFLAFIPYYINKFLSKNKHRKPSEIKNDDKMENKKKFNLLYIL